MSYSLSISHIPTGIQVTWSSIHPSLKFVVYANATVNDVGDAFYNGDAYTVENTSLPTVSFVIPYQGVVFTSSLSQLWLTIRPNYNGSTMFDSTLYNDFISIPSSNVPLYPPGAELQALLGTPVPSASIPCIPAGQRILTSDGYKFVEELKTGDSIVTSNKKAVPVKVYSLKIEKATRDSAPILIKKGAVGNKNDIMLSPLHTIQIRKNVWQFPYILLKQNVKGVSQVNVGESVTYYHIETPSYLDDNLIVEGSVVESYGNTFMKKANMNGKFTYDDLYTYSHTYGGFTRIQSLQQTNRKIMA